ncbi:MAG: hypothetical protein LAT64_09780 [Phycisphaerales bacterium]|nr:hypothetical protein [Planctomycetota bacterium]MCH8509038.1 hypothetical protein [Phycisphaerales bacterium]
MIPFFVGYAMFVWYLSARYRRTLLAYACALTGAALLIVLSYGHWVVGQANPELMIQGMQILLYPYTAAVGGVGIFIASLPRRYPEGCCRSCGYNLEGLGHPTDSCPECGRTLVPAKVVRYRASGARRGDLRTGDVRIESAPQGAPRTAGDQDHPGNQPEQHPSHAGQL